ncbi:hypothetical protein C8J45_10759 [Sphingomonas sp. PP-CE-3G-477]|uniref:hypothetical protein n=1 Tax=unclassified Sphingomonas TaxID=196159 RepID=UPI000D33DD2E|nr:MULTISPECIES: hypothetical protein [unclassified Sphingomonas]MBD8618675.1 hypothetical protein [Sphingomonas sp. CFBP 13728]MBE2993248.1 hypothetical protein [Sphingomonas sp. CFBP 13603]PTQ63072.1 hypothetical protein C8J45_10759 [Sphingomonas sp. PP-CE-3G-477]
MTYGSAIMFVVAGVLGIVGTAMLLRLRSPNITEPQTYAFRMIGIMLTSGAIVLAMSAAAMWQWSTET